ncbi:hypothetical protein A8C32_18805 [Flavivirga aquatica]|uniref:Uncharacterized protein n=1 Tax=Flavivirga aquatica TaxID=1849968 RepID=A0A1E5T3X7_9FLAO|nr:hypothetical protein [Flavivirga aquatica]OEK06082.1 hypothetical protein A8C32_18805 [Flavivirga aquatica]
MSKDLHQPQQSEEVDLGQLFKLIGSTFDKFFNFIGGIFKKIFLSFVWLLFFVKKHIIKFVIAGGIGLVLGIVLEKTSDPVYKSYITVKQNYNTGENLYNTIGYYNDLISQDITTLESVLGIDENQAASILKFDMESAISENQKLENFHLYIKELDTSLASKIDYKTFVKNSKDYSHQLQQITIKSKVRNNFKEVFEKLINNINSNPYFKREQEKDLKELKNEELALKEALIKSDSLQKTYKRVLERSVNKSGSEIGITIEGKSDKNITREYDLYLNDLDLRKRLVENERKQEDKKYILEMISSKQDSGTIDTNKEFLGLSLSPKLYYIFIMLGLTFILLLGIQFMKFLERINNID